MNEKVIDDFLEGSDKTTDGSYIAAFLVTTIEILEEKGILKKEEFLELFKNNIIKIEEASKEIK
ncbi:hypothetical protein [Rummeliibacillus sp. POC4]|uniref:hypothetical protein n=1 Tax=Rummeliibacillus sp. POC4 TaxID=2305899 RepID=UPI000E662C11|nr:hypothetical protein [Rummeliibacillus sp. POC4]RIJ64098.1 hypothetical protein D1606_11980 [Rummeliibacillus sp. POC4]